MRYSILVLPMLLAACVNYKLPRVEGLASIHKSQVLFNDFNETAPIVLNSHLYYIRGESEEYGHKFNVYNEQLQHVSEGPSGFAFLSSLALNGTVYVFGSDHNHINMSQSSDMVTWTPPIVVYEHSDNVYNTSVTVASDHFVMAFEVNIGGAFIFAFLKSVTLTSWGPIGMLFSGSYSACPLLRYVDDYYYVIYLTNRSNGDYVSNIARSKDLVEWQISGTAFLAPALDGSESLNTSDVDMVEYNGLVEINYGIGDQVGRGWTRRATYSGTIAQLFTEFF